MSFIGKPVYKVWAVNALRFGNVTEEKVESGRKYVRVDWKDDSTHQMDIRRVTELRNVDYDPDHEWDYIGNIRIFDPSKMISTLTKLC